MEKREEEGRGREGQRDNYPGIGFEESGWSEGHKSRRNGVERFPCKSSSNLFWLLSL